MAMATLHLSRRRTGRNRQTASHASSAKNPDHWRYGRKDVLTKSSGEGDHAYGVEKRIRRGLAARIPEKCPYELLDAIGYDPNQRPSTLRKIDPDAGVWPPDVAGTLNEELGTGYTVR